MIRRVPHASHWGCYTVLVQEDRIVGVEPLPQDPAPSPVIQSVMDWARPDRRVLRPMVRRGWLEARRDGRGSDSFAAVPWDEALDMVAGEITRVARDHGNASIFAGSYGWTSCGRFHHAPSLLKRMLNLAGGFTGHVDTYSIAAGPVILKHVLGDDAACGGYANSLDSIVDHTETLVVFGALSPRTAQTEAGGAGTHGLEGHLRQIADRGKRVILVSPLRDDLPDWLPCDWWQIRPNTDTALLLGVAGEILAAGRADADFLARCTSGADQWLAYLRGDPDGVAKTADWAAAICGIPADSIRALAGLMTTTRTMMTLSWSLQRARHGEQPYWAALGLAALAGQIGLPGGGVGYGYGSLGGMGVHLNIGKSPAISQGAKAIDSFIPVARIADMLLNPGAEFTYSGETRTYPDVRMVYWAGGNPYHHHQDLNRLEAAWARPETIVVQDPMFTATARRADIVLPASTSLERNDLAGNKRSDLLVAMHKAIDPVGQARSDFDIFNALAGRLGVAAAFNEGRDEMGWLRHMYADSRAAAAALGHAMPEFEAFWEQGFAEVPLKHQHTYLARFRADPEGQPLATESGRIVLGSDTLARLGHDDCPAVPSWLPPGEWLGAAEQGELHLISHQPNGRLHSQLETAAASRADKRAGREQARLNPAEAARRGIADGQPVRLWNARGACLATATICDKVAPGVVVLPTGAWFTPQGNSRLEIAGNPNVLTWDVGSSAFGQGCSAHTCLVRIDPWQGDAGDAMAAYDGELAALTA